MEGVSAAILAGGLSTRMGVNKALIIYKGKPLIERPLAKLKNLTSDVLIVSKTPGLYVYPGVRSVADVMPRHSALIGICSALHAAREKYCLVVACDMPFLNLDLLRYLIALAPYHDVVMPVLRKGPEPLHAVYSKECLPAIEKLIAKGEDKIVEFLPWVKVRYVDEDVIRFFDPTLTSFVNINTPKDLRKIRTNSIA